MSAEQVIQLPPDGTGKKIRVTETTVSGETVEQQVIQLADTSDVVVNPAKEDGNLAEIIIKLNDLIAVSGGTPNVALRVDEVGDILYVGTAAMGSATSAAAWRINKVDTSSGVIKTWADGDDNFDNIWDNRASLTYT